MAECRTVSISINRRPDEVYDFLADPKNFPKWSAFISDVREEGTTWLAETPAGAVRIRFTPKNEFRILDHDVTTGSGQTIHVPMRVFPNDERHCEVIFSVFRQPGMTGKQYEDDIEMVLADLRRLKRFVENEKNE